MATRNQISGDAKKALKSVPEGERADAQEYANLMAFMRGKSQITVRTRVGLGAQGWAPGGDTSEAADTLSIPAGGIARLNRTEGPNQDASMLAHMVAHGRMDVIDDKEFDKAEPYEKLIADHAANLMKQREAQALVGVDGHLAGIRARLDDLEKARPAK